MYENDRVTQHALAVVNGEVVSGRLHRLACQRHLKDLERQNTDTFPYYYEEAAAAEVLNYAETLTVSEGYEKTPVKLIPE